MSEVFIPSLNKSFPLNRKIGKLGGDREGPVLIFLGGMHGNEPSGMAALHEVFESYSSNNESFFGTAYAFSGNLGALSKGHRFIKEDLNRLWNEEKMLLLNESKLVENGLEYEEGEQVELFREIKAIMSQHNGPFAFFDLHTTSSHSVPFILINDTMNNRNLAKKFPLRIILGIEEYLNGPFLSYINDLGYISLAFEAGEHNDANSFLLHKKFILQCFLLTGFIKDEGLYQELIDNESKKMFSHAFFEILHRYEIDNEEEFVMNEGYANFDKVKKGMVVAKNQHGPIEIKESSYLFMPLYQTKGSEGFYLIKLIPTFWLQFSSFLRRINFDNLLLALPGVHRYDDEYKSLVVDGRIARFFSRDLFHLFGYRRSKKEDRKYLYIKRELSKQSSINF